MEGNSGGPLGGGVALSLGGNSLGSGGQNMQQLLQQPPHWAGQQQQQFFNTDFGSGQGGQQTGGQGLHHQQLLQQQQQMMQLAAAQAAGGGQGQHGPPGSSQQHMNQLAPTINMMIQAAQGMPHALQSPPNSGGPGSYQLLLPGIGHPHQGQQGRDISPNSTPSLSGGNHPGPSTTPPTLNELSDRNWTTQAQHNFFGGPRMMNHPGDKIPDDLNHHIALAVSAAANGGRGMSELFHGDAFSSRHQGDHLSINQMQLNDIALARGLNPYQYVPAHSPPHMFQQIPPHAMPPRPRPEGGQDTSPKFFNEHHDNNHQSSQKKDDLIIGSWNDEDIDKISPSQSQQQQQQQQHMFPPNFMMQQRPPMLEDKEPTGWGAPPPPNSTAASGWGGTTATHGPPPSLQHPPPNQQRKPTWQQQPTNIFEAPPPIHQGGYRGRGRGGLDSRPPRYNNIDFSDRGEGRGRGGFRGSRGGGGGPRLNVDHSQEKVDGKKSAIAETIAMMNKMKMEDKERKDAARQREEKRRELNPDSDLGDEHEPHPDEPAPPRRHGYHDRENFRGRGGGRGNRGNRFNNGPNSGPPMPLGALPPGPAGLFMSPPGGIPPFPGLENLMGGGPPVSFPGSYPAGPGNPFYGQFNPGFRFPRGGPNHRGGPQMFGFPPGPRGPFLPQMMARGAMMLPRGMIPGGMAGIGHRGGMNRGRGLRGGRGRGGNVYHASKEVGVTDQGADKHHDEDSGSHDDEEFDRGQAEGVESDQPQQVEDNSTAFNDTEGSKSNSLSEQQVQ